MPTLHWIGKNKIINHHLEVPYKILNHQYGFSENGKTETPTDGDNLIINGDNLEALKSLLPKYEGKVKCIYIDPPYNTGNEGWAYNDNVNSPQIQKWFAKVVGKESEDLTRHDKWLCMMYPRLKLLHKLLANDGAIFISIDDNEQANLKLMMDEIFGAGNFVSNIIWQRAYSPVNLKKTFSQNHDFVLCYSKNSQLFEMNGLERSVEANDRYKNLDNDARGFWKSSDLSVGPPIQENIYEITTPSGRKILPPKGYSWRLNKNRFEEFCADNRIWFGSKGDATPSIKRFLNEVKEGITPMTVWTYQEVGHTQDAKREIKSIFAESDLPFDTPKAVKLMERIVQLGTNKNSIILDSFAGSGTTAHAVLNLNKQDGGNRKFILIEMEDYAETITAERVKRVIKGYADKEGTGGGFDYYTLGEPLFNEDNNLNEIVDETKIREYVWFAETKDAYQKQEEMYLLGTNNGTAYYFYYEKNNLTTLDETFLRRLKTKASQYVIYADVCLLNEKLMDKYHIVFKKIPRDISKL
ncbi:site-specific DNA-methyltransferase [Pedobacter sp. UBA4863]|uniref:site-specific DNA-methyltransferase n=1 Tax=Pedobacter sp. UBA4863 TaxID=1947060 RepID=UPI0025DEF4DD|nr:site-specific DNA-methyltransferase [Pedobacter sp. UBA4863]